MSRAISIWFETETSSADIEVGNRDLLGTQNVSKQFWSTPILREIGIESLVLLGRIDPVIFSDWEDIKQLDAEITLLEEHISYIPFHESTKRRWIDNLRFCLSRLIEETPKGAIPFFSIG